MKSKISFLSLPLFFFLIFISCTAIKEEKPSFTAEASLDKKLATIGERVKYSITVRAKRETEVEFPTEIEYAPECTILDSGFSEEKSFRRKTLVQWYLLNTYVPKQYVFPKVTIKYREKGEGAWRQVDTETVDLEVASVLEKYPNAFDIRDVTAPANILPKRNLHIPILIAFFLLLSGFVGTLLLRKKASKRIISPKLPHQIAYRRLEQLRQKELVEHGLIKEYYTELSDILRCYFEARFHVKALEMTTEEFLRTVEEFQKLNEQQKNLLREFFSYCDMVKFAKCTPSEEEIYSSFELAGNLIDQTKVEIGSEQEKEFILKEA